MACLAVLVGAPVWGSVPAEVVSPRVGEALPAGGTVWLEWAPGDGFAELDWVTEWEAFLSLDGGQTFPVRLTPHLDVERRGVGVTMPLVPSDDVRLVLRFGDEGREVPVAVAGGFVLESSGPTSSLPLARSLEGGEAVWTGAPEVVVWASGSRGDRSWRDVVPAGLERTMGAPGLEASLGRGMVAVHEAPEEAHGPHAAPRTAIGAVVEPRSPRPGRAAAPRPAPLDPLLQTTRRNE